jgi:hypothetical protein
MVKDLVVELFEDRIKGSKGYFVFTLKKSLRIPNVSSFALENKYL